MQYYPVVLLFLIFGTHISVQQCLQNQILDITKDYFNTMSIAENSAPITVAQISASGQTIIHEMVKLIGIDGDIRWAIDTVKTLLYTKGDILNKFVWNTDNFLANYFLNTYMPAIRNALSEFLFDQQIEAFLEQLVDNRNQRQTFVVDRLKRFYDESIAYSKQIDSPVMDINRRAIEARNAGQLDLSSYDAELLALEKFISPILENWANNRDDSFGKGIQDYLKKFMVIIVSINKRCAELEREVTEC